MDTRYGWQIAAVLVVAALAAGCDGASEAPVQGMWMAESTPAYYLSIGRAEVAFYEPAETPRTAMPPGCYMRTAYDVLDIRGDTYILRNPADEADPWRMTLAVEEDRLAVVYEREEFGMSVERYSRVRTRPALLDERCAP